MIGYLKEFNNSMTMSFRVDDSELFKSIAKYGEQLKAY